MTLAEAMARAEQQLDDELERVLELSRESFEGSGIDPEVVERILGRGRDELIAWRAERLDELRRFLKYGSWEMPSMAAH